MAIPGNGRSRSNTSGSSSIISVLKAGRVVVVKSKTLEGAGNVLIGNGAVVSGCNSSSN